MHNLCVLLVFTAAGIFFALPGSAPAPRQARFAHHIVDSAGPLDPWLKSLGDLNGDGKIDLIAGGRANGGLVWYRNPDWAKTQITEGSFGTDAEAADIDGDGDLDVVAISEKPSSLSWYENPGWQRHAISAMQLHDIEILRFGPARRILIAARNQGSFGSRGDSIHFLQQQSDGAWSHAAIPVTNGEGLCSHDIDGDGDLDLVIERVWIENTGDPALRPWPSHLYAPTWDYLFTFAAAGSIGRNAGPAIVLAPSERAGAFYRLSVFEPPANPRSGPWRERVIEPKVEAVHHFAGIADFNGDGLGDIATAQMQQGADPDEVKIYLNPGSGAVWRKVVLSTGGSHSMRIADIDGDGDMDIYGANWNKSTIYEWWENLFR
ncbi:MAG: VCBS repeat-containing protein [Bryobacteraceae bacterium]|nr:VCBS repeat-containing protein [Bryobacteraceae bacterium]